jgi:hypothetical protein
MSFGFRFPLGLVGCAVDSAASVSTGTELPAQMGADLEPGISFPELAGGRELSVEDGNKLPPER